MKSIQLVAVLIALALLSPACLGQATTTSTTLSSAVLATDTDIYVASATGIAAPATQVSRGTILAVDREQMSVVAVDGLRITVRRGDRNTDPAAHASAATVWIGSYNYFGNKDPQKGGPCTATAQVALPLVVPSTGNVWNCVSSVWVQLASSAGVLSPAGTAATGVTAVEYGDKHRVVTLTFSGITVGAAVGAANLAFGKLIYTLPAGAAVIRAAALRGVALQGSGATCDADTPDVGLGSVIGSGANAVLSASATFEDILTGQTFDDVNGTAITAVVAQSLAVNPVADHKVHLNIADGWAGACTVTASGTVVLEYVLLN